MLEKSERTIKKPSTKQSSNKDAFIKRTWPNSRGFFEIATLHALNTVESLTSENPNLLDILGALPARPKKPVVIDLGMGNGDFLVELAVKLKELNRKADLIGVSASADEVRWHRCKYAGIQIIRGKLPHDDSVMTLLEERQGTADNVFDTYGPATYSNNPLHSLIFAAILLKSGGKFSAMTSTEGDSIATTVFGDETIRNKITEFFKAELDIDIKFEFSSIRSRVSPGKINTDLLVSFSKGNVELMASDYLNLCRRADSAVGVSRLLRPSWFSYRDFSIAMRTYESLERLPEIDPDSVIAKDELENPNYSFNQI